MQRLRIAVVGLGGIAQSVHLPLIARRWDLFELAALVDLSADRSSAVGRRYGVASDYQYTSIEGLIAAVEEGMELDGVILATAGTHGPPLLTFARAGLPVLCEKPVAMSTAEVDVVTDELQRTGRDPRTAVLVGYMKEHDPAVARARTELADKSLRAVSVEVLHPADGAQLNFARLLPAAEDVDTDVRADLEQPTNAAVDAAVGEGAARHLRTLYANVILGSIIHDVSLLRHLAGGITVADEAVHWGGLPGSLQVTGEVAGGARLHLGWHFITDYPEYRETVSFHHEEGSVQLSFAVPYLLNAATELTVTSPADSDGGEARTVYRWAQQEAFENELIAFHAMVARGAVPHSGLAEGRADIVTGQAILSALARREGVELGGEALAT